MSGRFMRALASATIVSIASMTVAQAAPRGGGGGGAPRGGGGMSRPAAPRSAPSAPKSGGFNFNNDITTKRPNPPAAPPRPTSGSNGNRPQPPPNNNGNRQPPPNNNGNRQPPPNNNNGNRNPPPRNNGNNNNNNYNHVTINNNRYVNNPVYYNQGAWGWNHGVAWGPVPYYWGGGFWGALAIGTASAAVGAAVYGSIVANDQHYYSYQVQPNSPGATMLSNYQLTQTQCGPPNLVVVYGPDNSVICAYPNNLVSAGNYTLDTQTLSLVSQ